MYTIAIKPLSVNEAWKGRRFKTDDYKMYEQILMYKLPAMEVPDGKLRIDYEFWFSNKLSDLDNPIKQFQDILTKRYKFKDSDIYEISVVKKIVQKGEEYIKFDIYSI